MSNRPRKPPVLAILAFAGFALVWLSQANSPGGEPPTQLADARAQRIEMLAELRKMNQQLAQLGEVLRDIRDDARKPAAIEPARGERRLPKR